MTKVSPRAFALAVLALASPTARAESITYTQTVVGSGSLGGVAYTDALVTFTQTADTDNIGQYQNFASVAVQAVTSTVSVAGLGAGSFTIPTSLYAAPHSAGFGLYVGTPASGTSIILSQRVPGLAGYVLRTSIAPQTGSGIIFFNTDGTFATTAGGFNLRSMSSNTTFAAALAPVPEPASIALAGIGLAGVVGLGLRRRASSRPAC